jgi:hypothetical protein
MNNNGKVVVQTFPSIGFLQILTIVFIILKLLGKITWSWWWVLAPLWGPIAIVFAILAVFLVLGLLCLVGAAIIGCMTPK